MSSSFVLDFLSGREYIKEAMYVVIGATTTSPILPIIIFIISDVTSFILSICKRDVK